MSILLASTGATRLSVLYSYHRLTFEKAVVRINFAAPKVNTFEQAVGLRIIRAFLAFDDVERGT